MTLRPRLLPLVVGCALLTGVVLALTRPVPPGVAADPSVVGRVVGVSAEAEVGSRWSAQPPGAVLFYADPAGRPVAGVRDAVVVDAGSCPGAPDSNRGFAGFAPADSGALAAVHAAAVARWTAGITRRARSPSGTESVRLVDGTPALRTRLRLRTPVDTDPCTAERVVLDLVSLTAATGVATFVLVRDVDPRGVSDTEAEAILQSLRSRT